MAKRLNSRNRITYREFDGVRVFGFGATARIAAAHGRTNIGNTECPLDIFVDGIRAQQADVNLIPPAALHGVEVYTVATAPARYRTGPCGALFLWTKIAPAYFSAMNG